MSVVAASEDGASASLARGVRVQARVIGALILRELHTRYGRDNIGYLWMILEPALLAISVSAMHFGHAGPIAGVDPISFALCGYSAFMIFRNAVLRAESVIEANRSLLFHRMVTVFDMLVARITLEAASIAATLTVLWIIAGSIHLVQPPYDILTLMAALILLVWFSFALSLLVCTVTYFNKAAAKIIHPITYMMLPASGAFYIIEKLPPALQHWAAWFPLAQIFELMHTGQFETVKGDFFNPVYVIGWCFALTFIGLLSIKVMRRHVHVGG